MFVNRFVCFFKWPLFKSLFNDFLSFGHSEFPLHSSYIFEFMGCAIAIITFIVLCIIPRNCHIDLFCDNKSTIDYFCVLKEPRLARLSEILNYLLFHYNISISSFHLPRTDDRIRFRDELSKFDEQPHFHYIHPVLIDSKRVKTFKCVRPAIDFIKSRLAEQLSFYNKFNSYNPSNNFSIDKLPPVLVT